MPYLFVLERASGTHKDSVQHRLSLLSSTCSVVCLLSQAYSNTFLLVALEAEKVSSLFVPWSAAERNGHKDDRYKKAKPQTQNSEKGLVE